MGGLLFDRDKSVVNPESLQPVFLLMSRAGVHASKGFTNVSPFLIQKSIDTVGGKIMECKKLRSGQLLIKCTNGKQANKIIKMMSLSMEIFVSVEEHKSLNTSKGIFYTNELRYLDDDEVKKEMIRLNPSIIEIKRLKKRDPETKKYTSVDSGLYIVTFNVPQIPEYIFVGYFSTLVNTYIPNPLRCFNCFKFGHISEKCSSTVKICPHCSCPEHTSTDETGRREKCNNQPKCTNCQNDHNSLSKECSVYKKEYEIQTIRVKENKSMYDARKEYAIRNPLPTTYANAILTTNKICNCPCKCQQSVDQKVSKVSPIKSLRETLSSVSSILETTKSDGTKITLIPKNISKRKKREIKNAEKKKKQNTQKYESESTTNNNSDECVEFDELSTCSSRNE